MKANNCNHTNAILDPNYTWCPDCQTEPSRELLMSLDSKDDDGCTDDEDTSLQDWRNEQEYLDEAREGAGYESEEARF